MIQIGDTITTSKSHVTGRVQEIVPNANGATARVRIEAPDGWQKWTTVPYSTH